MLKDIVYILTRPVGILLNLKIDELKNTEFI